MNYVLLLLRKRKNMKSEIIIQIQNYGDFFFLSLWVGIGILSKRKRKLVYKATTYIFKFSF